MDMVGACYTLYLSLIGWNAAMLNASSAFWPFPCLVGQVESKEERRDDQVPVPRGITNSFVQESGTVGEEKEKMQQ